MRVEVFGALSQALAACCDERGVSLERLWARAAWELLHCGGGDFLGLCINTCRVDSSDIVGVIHAGGRIPQEIISWLNSECRRSGREYIVKDHTLEPIGYGAATLCASVVVRVKTAVGFLSAQETYVWVGVSSAASPRLVEKIVRLARSVGEWLESMTPVLVALLERQALVDKFQAYKCAVLSVAHDVRAPLGALRYGLSMAVLSEGWDAQIEEELEYVEKMLSRLVENPDEDSSFQDREGVDVPALCRRVVSRFASAAQRKKIDIRVKVPDCMSAALVCELDLERVLSNSIGNAIVYSQASEVVVEISENADSVSISIRDNGVGMAPDVVQHINAGGEVPLVKSQGWGIGLKSSKQRIEANRGGFRVRAVEGQGSEVLLLLPVAKRDVLTVVTAQDMTDSGRLKGFQRSMAKRVPHVFLVDDDEEHNDTFARLLARYGVSVRTYTSVDALSGELGEQDELPIVCDINMPDGGAEKLLSLVRERGKKISLAVVSGEIDDERLYRLAALGAQAFFSKPIRVEQVIEWVKGAVVAPAATINCPLPAVSGRQVAALR